MVERFSRYKSQPTPKKTTPQTKKPCHHGLRPVIQSFKRNIHELHELSRIKTEYKDKRPASKNHTRPKNRVIPGSDPGSSVQGWQSPFATETGGLFQTGNSVASAERTSAARGEWQSPFAQIRGERLSNALREIWVQFFPASSMVRLLFVVKLSTPGFFRLTDFPC